LKEFNPFRFNAAASVENLIYGAERPAYPLQVIEIDDITQWIQFMKEQGILRICSLLTIEQLEFYKFDLLEYYSKQFGEKNICWAPIKDFHFADVSVLKSKILPFLFTSLKTNKKTIVHCSGGIGRTGHVLAAWLVYARNFSIEKAFSEVIKMDRNPFEAIETKHETKENLYKLFAELQINNQ